jgi:nitrate reductase gamma subunit
MVFLGFMLCFASTSVATFYHYGLGLSAPYAMTSLPKLFGITGGVAMVIGTTGLWRLRLRRHPEHIEPSHHGMDLGFIALLFLTASTGLLLMVARETAALPATLCVHLGAVMALFLTMPYGKFAHGIFRTAALLRYAVERRLRYFRRRRCRKEDRPLLRLAAESAAAVAVASVAPHVGRAFSARWDVRLRLVVFCWFVRFRRVLSSS